MQMPLPYPADELQSEILAQLNGAASDLARLRVFFRGHEKSIEQLMHLEVRIGAAVATAKALEWPLTNVGNCWKKMAVPHKFSDPVPPSTTIDGTELTGGVE